MRPIILASASEGRRELFRQSFGEGFACHPMDIPEEDYYHLPVRDMVHALARRKALACAARNPDAMIFAFDTMVECRGRVLGKPSSPDEAKTMLAELSGKEQSVWTGYAFSCGGCQESGAEEAVLAFALSPEEIDAYVQKHPVTKYAGAYAIQKSDTKARLIRGDFDVVIGACMGKVRGFYQKNIQ